MRPSEERDVRAAGVDDRGERLIVDLDQLSGVLGQRARIRDHGGHGLADVAHFLAGQDRMRVPGELGALERRDRERPHPVAEVGCGQNRQQPVGGGRRADAPDLRVGERAAHKCDVGHARALEVVEVLRLAAQDALILTAPDRAADQHSWPRIQSATSGRYLNGMLLQTWVPSS